MQYKTSVSKLGKWKYRGTLPLSKMATKAEQNGAKISSISPSSEELWVRKETRSKRLPIVHGFRPENENVNFHTMPKHI